MREYIIVDDLYENYTLAFEANDSLLFVECETCNATVCVLDRETVEELSEDALYERILELHRPI